MPTFLFRPLSARTAASSSGERVEEREVRLSSRPRMESEATVKECARKRKTRYTAPAKEAARRSRRRTAAQEKQHARRRRRHRAGRPASFL
jgi:hypothetical protein